jgi:hypothetical protein
MPIFQPDEDLTATQLRAIREEHREEKASWRDDMDIYKLSLMEYKDQQKGLRLVDQAISSSVDPKLQRVLDRLDTTYERLRFLGNRFSRTNSYSVETFYRWRTESMKGPEKGGNVLQWLDNWEHLREEVISLKYEDATHHPLLFLKAVKEVLPLWWEARFQQTVIAGQTISIQSMLESFRATYAETRTVIPTSMSRSKPAFATSTWQGHPEARSGRSNKTISFKDRQECPCGGRGHLATKCWTINQYLRPKGWEPYEDRIEAVRRSFEREPEWKAWIEARSNKMNTSVITSAITSTNDDQTANLTHIAYRTEPKAWATALSTIEDHHRDQWILDSGASVHVCNDRTKFIEYRDCVSSLQTGESQTPTLGIGTAVMDGINPTTGDIFKVSLMECHYAPSFHCNLVSLGRLEKKGSWWDMRKECIVHQKAPILKVYRERDVYVFGRFRPKSEIYGRDQQYTQQQSALTTRTSTRPQISIVTEETWHRRLGHVYSGVIK